MKLKRYEGNATDFYLAGEGTADIVNLAIDLGRPLLVEGEPGCGKTQLAYSIAKELDLGSVVKISVKSGTKAQDLLYRMNALARLQDAQRADGSQQARHVYPYLTLGLLGTVIHERQRRVVLIDEVDKADIDFPNDLLDVLDNFSFQIDELPPEEEAASLQHPRGKARGFGRTVEGDRQAPPIVVLTSNREKRLPEPFLRRCLYVRVTFPKTAEELREIVRRNTRESLEQLSDSVLNAAAKTFIDLRQLAAGLQKPPTTSELIDWVRILHWRGITPEDLAADPWTPPYWQTLFKTMGDLDAYAALAAERSKAKTS